MTGSLTAPPPPNPQSLALRASLWWLQLVLLDTSWSQGQVRHDGSGRGTREATLPPGPGAHAPSPSAASGLSWGSSPGWQTWRCPPARVEDGVSEAFFPSPFAPTCTQICLVIRTHAWAAPLGSDTWAGTGPALGSELRRKGVAGPAQGTSWTGQGRDAHHDAITTSPEDTVGGTHGSRRLNPARPPTPQGPDKTGPEVCEEPSAEGPRPPHLDEQLSAQRVVVLV